MTACSLRLRAADHGHLIDYPFGSAEFLGDEEYVADVHGNCAIAVRVLVEIIPQTFVIAVENESDLFSAPVENG